ncbi:MAG TPA: TrbC/VirB2 family protein [Oligoflexia bacterium]|nr:TrbC/VirB2 family protein [Oligoflexia bacterium]
MLMKNNARSLVFSALSAYLFFPAQAWASSTGMPWEGPLQQIADSISGPVAQSIAVLAIVAAGLALAFGEGGGGVRRGLWIVFGLSVAFAASSFFLSFFGFASGAVC